MKVIFMQKKEGKKIMQHYITLHWSEFVWGFLVNVSASLNNPRDLNKLKGYFIYYSESNKGAGFNNINS